MLRMICAAALALVALSSAAIAGDAHELRCRQAPAPSTSRAYLVPQLVGILEAAERRFGVKRLELASTCRPGARIRDTGRISEHASGRAADVVPPTGVDKRELVRWFYDHTPGLVMTYVDSGHIHVDVGRWHKISRGVAGVGDGADRHGRRARHASSSSSSSSWLCHRS